MAVITLINLRPAPRADGKAWTGARLEGIVEIGDAWEEIESFEFETPDADPLNPQYRSFTTEDATDDLTFVRVSFVDEDGDESPTPPIALTSSITPLADQRRIRRRLGRPLTDTDIVQIQEMALEATVNILGRLDLDLFDPDLSDQAREYLAGQCARCVCRAMSNPQGLGQLSYTMGAVSETTTYARELPGDGLELTDREELLCRRIVFGSNGGSANTITRQPTPIAAYLN